MKKKNRNQGITEKEMKRLFALSNDGKEYLQPIEQDTTLNDLMELDEI